MRKFLLCTNCGNLIEFIKDSGVTPICCGQNMKELIPNMVDASGEKHIPIIKLEENKAIVQIGEMLHPMSEEHFIEWIYLETTNGIKRAKLNPNEEPIKEFALSMNEEVISAYAYCNLHGLWLKEVKE